METGDGECRNSPGAMRKSSGYKGLARRTCCNHCILQNTVLQVITRDARCRNRNEVGVIITPTNKRNQHNLHSCTYYLMIRNWAIGPESQLPLHKYFTGATIDPLTTRVRPHKRHIRANHDRNRYFRHRQIYFFTQGRDQ